MKQQLPLVPWKLIAIILGMSFIAQSIIVVYLITISPKQIVVETEQQNISQVDFEENKTVDIGDPRSQGERVLEREEILPVGIELSTYLHDNFSEQSEYCTTISNDKLIDTDAVMLGEMDGVFLSLGVEDSLMKFWRESLAEQTLDGNIIEYCTVPNYVEDEINLYMSSVYFLVDNIAGEYAYVLSNKQIGVEDGVGSLSRSQPTLATDIMYIYPKSVGENTILYKYSENNCVGEEVCGWIWSYVQVDGFEPGLIEDCYGSFDVGLGGYIADNENVYWTCWNEYKE